MLTRRALVSRTFLTSSLAAGGSGLGIRYAAAIEPKQIHITRYRFTPERWPVGLQLRVALLADFHAHPRNMNEQDLATVVERTNALQPDVTVLLGDYGSQSPGPVAPEVVADLMRGLVAPKGVYAIQGNHDWTDDPAAMQRRGGPTRVARAFLAAGIPFLDNKALPLDLGASVWIAGLESEETRSIPSAVSSNPSKLDQHRTATLAQMLNPVPFDASVLLLAHEPDIFATGLDPRVAVTLSGHTHGGQIRILGWSPWIPSRYGLRYAYGHIIENERHLVVSGGLGSHFVVGRPLRIGIPPEIVVVELGVGPNDVSV